MPVMYSAPPTNNNFASNPCMFCAIPAMNNGDCGCCVHRKRPTWESVKRDLEELAKIPMNINFETEEELNKILHDFRHGDEEEEAPHDKTE